MSDYCEYCHTDRDGYVTPLIKNAHAYLYPTMGVWKLCVRFKNAHYDCNANYCPICGRNLKEGK